MTADADALVRQGDVQHGNEELAAALDSYNKALALNPAHAGALTNRGYLFRAMKRPAEALASFDAALRVAPHTAFAHHGRAGALVELQRYDEALAAYSKANEVAPDYVDAYVGAAELLAQLGRHTEAIAALKKAVDLKPDMPFAKGQLLHAMMRCCHWNGLTQIGVAVDSGVAEGLQVADPFGYQAYSEWEGDLKRCAEIYAAARFPPMPAVTRPTVRHERIRIGYLCGEFRAQATSLLMAGVYERHDKSRFEIFAFDNGWDDGSDLRRRLVPAFDAFVDISTMSDPDAAAAIASRGIDIFVNLNGYFGRGRQGVFARRPAPIQVNYLGFPGTIGADYIDYLIADRIVIPPESREHYTEKIVYLPDCYQANDDRRENTIVPLTRATAGLPKDGFVFCCFNNNYKITPQTFDGWMRIMKQVPGSVLWLLADNQTAVANLRRWAQIRGIAAERLVFAERAAIAVHLARHGCADLFLDTLPYNAHTTAADALWADLPVLTCRGTTFPGRVAASLLTALGMPELITENADDYEAAAVRLATEPQALHALRDKIARHKASAPLFDTARFTRGLEAAFTAMMQRRREGLAPDHIAV